MLFTAVLKENNYKIPASIEEFEAMLKDYIAAHPPTEDGLDTIGITLSTSDLHWLIPFGNPTGHIATGKPDNGQLYVEVDHRELYKCRDEDI